MVFSSYVFILAFLPLTILGYYLLSKLNNPIYQKLFLLTASLFFYGYYNAYYLILIIASIAVNYIIALLIQHNLEKGKLLQRLLLSLGILFNVALIGYFKYYDFFVDNINQIFSFDFTLHHLILPLGISFFTFQQLSFIVSVYKKEEAVDNLLNYSLFVTFFPQLVAGPIVLYSEMIPQLSDPKRRYFNAENFASGIYIFAIGLFKKTVIADTLALFVDNGFALTNIGLAASWATAISYTLQIYFDFSGYSDMAIGLGKMFNLTLPHNFFSPYKSESITVFWRRWHITLGRALSTYVYIPLGGNRRGKALTCLNLFATFFVSGLWHGASWTFVLWGVLHGIFSIIERLGKNILSKIPRYIRIAATFLTVNFLWVLFRAENFVQAAKIYQGMFDFQSINLNQLAKVVADEIINFPLIIDMAYLFALLAGLLIIVFFTKNSVERLEKFKPSTSSLITTALLFVISILCLARESIFIYFNF